MNIYHLTLNTDMLPLTYDYYSAIMVCASSEEEARNLADKDLIIGHEKTFDLERVKEHYMSYENMKEKFKKHGEELTYKLYDELTPSNWGFVINNEIWKNPEFTKITEIGSSHSTEPKVYIRTYHAG
jgi:hypothetical protein